MHNPIALIFAAGKGERLQPYTIYYQKCILPINGKPLLTYWLDALDSQPMHIYKNVIYGYHPQQVISVVQTWERLKDPSFIYHSNDESVKGLIPGHEQGVNLVYMPPRDKIWQDILSYFDMHPTLVGRSILICLGDNYSPELMNIIYCLFRSYNDLLDNNILGIASLITQSNCSSVTQEAILGYSLGDFANGLYIMNDYHFNKKNVRKNSFAWAGIALLSPEVLKIKEANRIEEVFSVLAKQGKFLGKTIYQEYFDIGTLERYWKQK